MNFNKLTDEDIKEINSKASWDEGVFIQPNHIPVTVKGYVIYKRVTTGGASGGDCYGGRPSQYSIPESQQEDLSILGDVLTKIAPNITYLQYRKIEKEMKKNHNNYSDSDYYGNYTNYDVKWIELESLYDMLGEM